MDCSLPGSSVHGIFQAIVLEWIAISFSRGSSQPRDRTWVSRIADRRFTIWGTREVLPVRTSIHLSCSYYWMLIYPISDSFLSAKNANKQANWQNKTNNNKHFFNLVVKVNPLSRVRLFATPWTVAYQAPPSMGFSRQEYWSRLPFLSPNLVEGNR